MEYTSVRETAQRWGVTERAVQKWAKQGKLAGALKDGRDWRIPISAYRPGEEEHTNTEGKLVVDRFPFPLVGASFEAGHALEYVESIEDEEKRKLAMGEYYYLTGELELCVEYLEPFLNCEIREWRYNSALVILFAYLGREHTHLGDFAAEVLRKELEDGFAQDSTPEFEALGVLGVALIEIQLHLPYDKANELERFSKYLPSGLKLLACYLLAYKAYTEKRYERSLAIVDTALICIRRSFPIPTAYAQIICVVALMNLKRTDEAMTRFRSLHQLTAADGVVMPYVEHHGILLGMIEVYFKQEFPEEYKRLIKLINSYNRGWNAFRERDAEQQVAQNLTTMEFTVAMLYNRGWKIREIAEHIAVSERTVKNRLQIIYEKLGISGKKELAQYMLK